MWEYQQTTSRFSLENFVLNFSSSSLQEEPEEQPACKVAHLDFPEEYLELINATASHLPENDS